MNEFVSLKVINNLCICIIHNIFSTSDLIGLGNDLHGLRKDSFVAGSKFTFKGR